MAVKESMNIVVVWKRSNKKIDTKVKQLTADDDSCRIDESFQMKTALEWIPGRKQFKKKRSDFQVHSIDMAAVQECGSVINAVMQGHTVNLGTAQMDLA